MSSLDANHYLLRAQLLREKIPAPDQFPFNLACVRELEALEFHPKVTFIIGENGSGKSTLLEALAVAWGFNAEGGTRNFNFSTRTSHTDLRRYLRLIKSFRHPRDGFFLRAESFYNVASNMDELDEDPFAGPRIKESYGGQSLHQKSHGESFFALMQHRFGGNGLYILDEPEAALSPSRQMAMLLRMRELVEANSQFIIATHSPILLAYPEATIYVIEPGGLRQSRYQDTEHYQLTRRFLNDTDGMLARLFGDE